MTQETSFGRRRPSDTPKAPEPFDPWTLSPEAEAFRASLKADSAKPDDFRQWRQDESGRRLTTWVLSAALLSPGALCFVLQTPPLVSIGLEALGVCANIWLRQERRRRLKAITAWQPDPEIKAEISPV